MTQEKTNGTKTMKMIQFGIVVAVFIGSIVATYFVGLAGIQDSVDTKIDSLINTKITANNEKILMNRETALANANNVEALQDDVDEIKVDLKQVKCDLTTQTQLLIRIEERLKARDSL